MEMPQETSVEIADDWRTFADDMSNSCSQHRVCRRPIIIDY